MQVVIVPLLGRFHLEQDNKKFRQIKRPPNGRFFLFYFIMDVCIAISVSQALDVFVLR